VERRTTACFKKKAIAEQYRIYYADEASVSLTSYVARTYAKRGRRPILEVNTEISQRLYIAGAVSSEGDLAYQVRDKPFDGTTMTAFLSQLLHSCEPQQQKVMVIWDNASIHNCAATHAFLSSDQQAKQRLHLAQQPRYCPNLNAAEQLWAHLKCEGLKSTCFHTLQELRPKLTQELDKLKNNPNLIRQFFLHPDLGYS